MTAGTSDGPAVLLLHGWPYDIHSLPQEAPQAFAEAVIDVASF